MESSLSSLLKVLEQCTENPTKPLPFKGWLIHLLIENHSLATIAEDIPELPCFLVTKYEQKTEICEVDGPSVVEPTHSFDGSPLKLEEFHFESSRLDVSNTEVSAKLCTMYRPVTVSEARTLLSWYNRCKMNLYPMWILCDGKDPEHSVFLGCHVSSQSRKMQYCMANATVTGPQPQHSLEFEKIWKRRLSFLKERKNQTWKCLAKYSQQRNMEISFHWNKSVHLLQIPFADSRAVVKATIQLGATWSAGYDLYRELAMLQQLLEGATTGVMHWPGNVPGVELLQGVKNLVSDCMNSQKNVEAEEEKPDDDSIFLRPSSSWLKLRRDNLEFTDKLWLILKDCQNFQDLVQCLEYIIDKLKTGDLHPMVNPENKTKLGQLIKDSYSFNVSLPSLEDMLPVQILVELGVQKLYNDYIYSLYELTSADYLEPFAPKSDDSLSEKLVNLEKLQCTVELVAILETVAFPFTVYCTATRLALAYYKTNAAKNGDTFTFPVSGSVAKAAVERLLMNVWQADISCPKGDAKKRIVYMFTTEPPFDHLDVTTPGSSGDASYYLTCFKKDVVFA